MKIYLPLSPRVTLLRNVVVDNKNFHVITEFSGNRCRFFKFANVDFDCPSLKFGSMCFYVLFSLLLLLLFIYLFIYLFIAGQFMKQKQNMAQCRLALCSRTARLRGNRPKRPKPPTDIVRPHVARLMINTSVNQFCKIWPSAVKGEVRNDDE